MDTYKATDKLHSRRVLWQRQKTCICDANWQCTTWHDTAHNTCSTISKTIDENEIETCFLSPFLLLHLLLIMIIRSPFALVLLSVKLESSFTADACTFVFHFVHLNFCATDDQTVNHIKQNTFCFVTRTIMLHILHLVSSNANLIWLKVLDWVGCFTISFFLSYFLLLAFSRSSFFSFSLSISTHRPCISDQSGEMAIATQMTNNTNTRQYLSFIKPIQFHSHDRSHRDDYYVELLFNGFFFLSHTECVVDFMMQ